MTDMVAVKEKRGLPRDRRQAAGAHGSTQVSFWVSLAHDADAHYYLSYFICDLTAPCCDMASRRTYALAALYVDSILRDLNRIVGHETGIDFDMLVTILRSSLRMRRSTAVCIVHALADAGMLVIRSEPEVI